MLIGVDASRAVARRAAGVGHYSRFLISAMSRQGRGHSLRLYANGHPAPDWLPTGAEWRDMPWPRLWTHLRLSAEMARHAPDALFVPAHVVPPVHPTATVVTIHDLGYLYYPECHGAWQRLYLRLSTAWSAAAAAVILADSEATRCDIVRELRLPAEKVVVAYPGVTEPFRPRPAVEVEALRLRLGLPPRYLLFLGTIQPRKNLRRLMEAHGQLSDAPPLVVAGGAGWLSEPLLRQAEEAGERVRLAGYVDDEDLPALLTGATAFLLPSLYEGFGMPVLEAMACGTPVLVSRNSSLPEIAGDCGVLVDPYSVESIADGIRGLYQDRERALAMALRARERARQFTWERCADTALAALERAHASR
ncbi:MAG: glycosyltransferase family 4 protein [Anaerolineae bacterium]